MDIFKLYNDIKYFKIEFSQTVDQDDIYHIEEIIKDTFDMQQSIELTKPVIKADEINLNCEHSHTYARLSINARDQSGLLAYVIKTFDDMQIDIATAKVHTIRNRVRDQFLIEKHQNVCHNTEKIIDALVNKV